MDNIKALITAHSNATKLENEIQKVRSNLIKAYQNDTSHDAYLLKIKYDGYTTQLTKETSIFTKLLVDFEKNESVINEPITADITEFENIDCESSTQPEVNESYDNNSVAMTDSLSVQTPHLNTQLTDNISIPETQSQQQISENKEQKNKIHKHNKHYSGQWVKKTGYKYTAKGFEVFTGWKNKCKPIYSSTLLYCYETCNGNKKALRNYLIEYGKFKNEMIIDFIFKQNYSSHYNYVLVKVKGPLNYIKKKMVTLNKSKGSNIDYDIISLFKSRRIISDTEWVYMNKVLYVNNFDILRKNTHKRF
eukprot:250952_1